MLKIFTESIRSKKKKKAQIIKTVCAFEKFSGNVQPFSPVDCSSLSQLERQVKAQCHQHHKPSVQSSEFSLQQDPVKKKRKKNRPK